MTFTTYPLSCHLLVLQQAHRRVKSHKTSRDLLPAGPRKKQRVSKRPLNEISIYSNFHCPGAVSLINTLLVSSSEIRPALRIAVVKIVFLIVGNPAAS